MSLVRQFSRFSTLKNIRRYKGSQTQERLHDYESSDSKIQPIKDQIDYDTILR